MNCIYDSTNTTQKKNKNTKKKKTPLAKVYLQCSYKNKQKKKKKVKKKLLRNKAFTRTVWCVHVFDNFLKFYETPLKSKLSATRLVYCAFSCIRLSNWCWKSPWSTR